MNADADAALAAASALHAGFQLAVTTVVYPAFAEIPLESWPAHHAAHSRRVVVPVALVYGVVLITCGVAVVAGPGPLAWTAVIANAVAGLTTAAVAAPAHAQLSSNRDPFALHRLIAADRVRTVCAMVAAVSAVIAAA